MQLTSKQHEVSKQYLDLLHTIEEGFEYVITSFSDYEKTEGDRVLADIFSAFVQVAESNMVMSEIFKEEPSIIKGINSFEEVVKQASKLEGHFDDSNEKERIVRESLHLAFAKWKNLTQQELQPYIIN